MAGHNPEPEVKKSSKKLIIIIVAVLLLLGGAGGGYYFFVLKGDHAAEGDTAEHGSKEKDKHQATEEAETPAEGEKVEVDKQPIFFDLTHPMIVNFPNGSGASLVQISLSFLAENDETAVELKKHEPMLRNNLMMKISAQTPENLKTKEGKEALRALLLEEVNQVLSKVAVGSHVKEVFFTALVMQ